MIFLFSVLNDSRVHLGISGSVAAYKSVELLRLLQKQNINVGVTLTASAEKFISSLTFKALNVPIVYTKIFDDNESSVFGHLEPGQICHSFAIVPATATTVSRISSGLADEILSAQALAFPRPLLIAPAMNPTMWKNQATQENVITLKSRGHIFIMPESGTVACGDTGEGKLASIEKIYWSILRDIIRAKGLNDLEGKKVMVTLGPTRESWDAVRFWTNHSTGYMGACFVFSAWLRGADVYAVAGPITINFPSDVHIFPCVSASDMYDAATSLWKNMDLGIFTAAVADYSPEKFGNNKFKKSDSNSSLTIQFSKTRDILAELGKAKANSQKVIGFAAETEQLEDRTRNKLKNKNADMIVGNLVGKVGSGFGSARNSVFICNSSGKDTFFNDLPKSDLAWKILDLICLD